VARELRDSPVFATYPSFDELAASLMRRDPNLDPDTPRSAREAGGIEHTRLRTDGSDAHLPEVLQNVRIETIAGAGQMLHDEQPGEVARLIEEFLQRP
jgi:pimeloyl-ACP methyl ester carboxylesterase